jgi:hypothetical protein
MIIGIYKTKGKGESKRTILMATFNVKDEAEAMRTASEYIGQWTSIKDDMFWDELTAAELAAIEDMSMDDARADAERRRARIEEREAAREAQLLRFIGVAKS